MKNRNTYFKKFLKKRKGKILVKFNKKKYLFGYGSGFNGINAA